MSEITPHGAPADGGRHSLDYGRREPTTGYHRGLHAVAIVTAVATFPLIFMGGLVTSHQAGLAVPDWPNSFGYNMFAFPPSLWVGGIFYEHTHRLMGTLVGLLAIILCFWTLRVEQRRWVRWLSLGVLAAVIGQGVLGGLRVIWINLDLAIVHACVAQAFFCLTALMAVVTSRWWIEAPDLSQTRLASSGRWLVGVAAFTVTVIYLQLVAGAFMRHYAAGLAIPDFPLAYGQLLPPMDQDQLAQANAIRAQQLQLPMVSLYQVHVHFVHRLGAVIVALASLWLFALVMLRHRDHPRLRHPAWLLLVLIVTQFELGAMTVLMRKPADITSAHVAVGALALLTSFVLLVRAMRLYGPMGRAQRLATARPDAAVGQPAIGW